jgi:hypothetical protein
MAKRAYATKEGQIAPITTEETINKAKANEEMESLKRHRFYPKKGKIAQPITTTELREKLMIEPGPKSISSYNPNQITSYNTQFDQYVDQICESIKSTLKSKAKEYASGKSRFHNFEQAATINDTSPEQALWGMYSKHLVSVKDMVHTCYNLPKSMIDEKILDSINYHILLGAILLETKCIDTNPFQ